MRSFVLAVVVLVGCHDDPHGPAVASEAHIELVREHCEKAFECKIDWSPNQHLEDFPHTFKASVTECEMAWTWSTADLARLDSAVSAAHITYNDVAAGRCLEDVTSASCPDWFDYTGGARTPGGCDGMLTPHLALGEACQLTIECVNATCISGSCAHP